MDMYHQQSDIRLLRNGITTIPRIVPGRMSTEDFVFFIIPHNINPKDFTVVVMANDTAGPMWRSIGPLQKQLYLPEVNFGAHSNISVIPKENPSLPSFMARLNRGSTYVIPEVNLRAPAGVYQMDRHGITNVCVDNNPWLGADF
jgi:hypothetical protein